MRAGSSQARDPDLVVRQATMEDAAGIHTLACELANTIDDAIPNQDAVTSRLFDLLEEPAAGVLVAESAAQVVGIAYFWVKPDLAHGDVTCEVPMLAVAQTHRRKGVGRMLMSALKELAARKGAALIELVTVPSNVVAREFYRSIGFTETDHISLEFTGLTPEQNL